MTAYDQLFEPPAPTTLAEIKHPSQNSNKQSIIMQFDSAADMTCVPESAVSAIPNLDYGSVDVIGYAGAPATHRTWFISLSFAGHHFDNIEAIGIEDNIGLIGRDILNRVKTILDGPNLEWEVQ